MMESNERSSFVFSVPQGGLMRRKHMRRRQLGKYVGKGIPHKNRQCTCPDVETLGLTEA